MAACPDIPCPCSCPPSPRLGFVAVTLWTIAFLAGVLVPRVVDGPARTTTAVAVAVDLALLRAVRRAALGDGASPGQGMAAPSDPCVARAHDVRPRHRHLPRPAAGAVATLGRPGLARARRRPLSSCGRSARPAGSWRSPRRSRSTTSSSPGCGRPAGRPLATLPRTTALQVGGLHAIVRHPLMTGLLTGLLGDPAHGRLAPALRPRLRPPTSRSGSGSRSATCGARSERRTTPTPPTSRRCYPDSPSRRVPTQDRQARPVHRHVVRRRGGGQDLLVRRARLSGVPPSAPLVEEGAAPVARCSVG